MSGIFVVARNNADIDSLSLARRVGSTLAGPEDRLREYGEYKGILSGWVGDSGKKSLVQPHLEVTPGVHIAMEGILYSSGREYAKRLLGSSRAESDVHTIGELYVSDKLRTALPYLNGQFFILVIDHRRNLVFACNDRYGLYPYYWAFHVDRLYIGPRILGAVLAGVVSGIWNTMGITQFLSTGDYLGDHTPLSGVHAFPPGSVMQYRSDDTPTFERYWRLRYTSTGNAQSIAGIGEELGQRFVESVRRQSEATDTLGITLSGGLDSRCILAATSNLHRPVHTFTWGRADSEEIDIARHVARRFESIHHEYPYNSSDFENLFDEFGRTAEGMLDLRDAHFLTHARFCNDHVSGILNGYAGDLLLGGSYLRGGWNRPLHHDVLAEKLFTWRNSIVPQDRLNDYLAEHVRIEKQNTPVEQYKREIEGIHQDLTPDVSDTFFLENRVRRTTSMGTVLMRRKLESFSPFFDYDFVDYVMTIPPKYRIYHRAYRSMIRSRFSECAKVPWDRTMLSPLAPVALMLAAKARKKIQRSAWNRFGIRIGNRGTPIVDFSSLFGNELRTFIEESIHSSSIALEDVLNVHRFREAISGHSESTDRSALIGVFISLLSFGLTMDRIRSRSTDAEDTKNPWTRLY